MGRTEALKTLNDVDVAPDQARTEALADQDEITGKTGVFSRIFAKKDDKSGGFDPSVKGGVSDKSADAPKDTPEKPRRGLWPFGGKTSPTSTRAGEKTARRAPETVPVSAPAESGADASTGLSKTDAPAAKPKRGLRLFGKKDGASSAKRKSKTRSASLIPELAPGARPAVGQVVKRCDLRPRDMGRLSDKYPQRAPRYKLYDSAPNNTATRAFYITGFTDGCAREIHAAVAMFAGPVLHEQLRFGAPAKVLARGGVDAAYDKIKRKTCGAGRKTPCGSKIAKLDKTTAFVTAYPRAGGPQWANLLLHDGVLMAADAKGK